MHANYLEQLIGEGKTEEIRNLLNQHPALVNSTTSHGIKPLLLAAHYQMPLIVQVIAEYIPELTFFEATVIGDTGKLASELVKDPSIIDSHSDEGFTALGLSCLFNNMEVAQYLLKNGADPNICSSNGYAIYPLHSACLNNNLSIAALLISNGAQVNITQKAGLTPLHIAAEFGNVDLIILLLEQGAKTHVRMEGGKLPCDCALEKGYTEIAEILAD